MHAAQNQAGLPNGTVLPRASAKVEAPPTKAKPRPESRSHLLSVMQSARGAPARVRAPGESLVCPPQPLKEDGGGGFHLLVMEGPPILGHVRKQDHPV